MGLDITAYSKLKKLDVLFDADGEPVNPETREPLEYSEYVKVYANHDFPGRVDPLEDKAVYSYDGAMSFRAGSYGGYNGWRETLAALAGYPKVITERVPGYAPSREERHDAAAWAGKADGLPFVELVNFSDCEGTIGSTAAAKLAADFRDFNERAKTFRDPATDWFYDRYQLWMKACELAAYGGCIAFH